MRFGPVPVAEAEGAILAHSVRCRAGAEEGACWIGEDVAALVAAGIGQVTVARLDPGDVAENDAALAAGRRRWCPSRRRRG
jgi:molybdenum cofactor cytidylyltransferase